MANCLFSVVIPLYNMADTIKRTIDTVLHQICQDFEIVVVDDGSKDDGASVAKAIGDERITVIQQSNKGVSAARNKGIEHAKGQFVTFLDADDEYTPEHLETLKHLIDTYPDYNIYATSYMCFRGGKKVMPSIKGLHFKNLQNSNEGVLDSYFHTVSSRHNPVHVCSIAVRRTVLVGGGEYPLSCWSWIRRRSLFHSTLNDRQQNGAFYKAYLHIS